LSQPPANFRRPRPSSPSQGSAAKRRRTWPVGTTIQDTDTDGDEEDAEGVDADAEDEEDAEGVDADEEDEDAEGVDADAEDEEEDVEGVDADEEDEVDAEGVGFAVGSRDLGSRATRPPRSVSLGFPGAPTWQNLLMS
jgi:hypothetical protein